VGAKVRAKVSGEGGRRSRKSAAKVGEGGGPETVPYYVGGALPDLGGRLRP